jgi:Mce-associated membrane protein
MTTTDTDSPAPATPAEAPHLPAPSARLRRAWLLVDLALVALVVAALVAVALTARSTFADRADEQARSDALAAARRLAVGITSLDYRTYDRDAQRLVDDATGDLKEQLQTESPALKKAMTTARSTTTGSVLEAALVDADHDSARVLLVVDADVTNTSTKKPSARHYRMQLDLSRQGDRWLGSDLTFVG